MKEKEEELTSPDIVTEKKISKPKPKKIEKAPKAEAVKEKTSKTKKEVKVEVVENTKPKKTEKAPKVEAVKEKTSKTKKEAKVEVVENTKPKKTEKAPKVEATKEAKVIENAEPTKVEATKEVEVIENTEPAKVEATKEVEVIENTEPAKVEATKEVEVIENTEPAKVEATKEVEVIENTEPAKVEVTKEVKTFNNERNGKPKFKENHNKNDLQKIEHKETVFKTEFKVGRNTYTIETGELALLANGSVKIAVGEAVLLVTATASNKPREGIDFFPLMVDYEEKMYSVGKIPGNYFRRESRPPESSILTSRLIDRPIRPLFLDGYFNDVQVIATLLSSDQELQSDIIAVNGASAALSLSDIPFLGPIGAVRIGRIDNKWIIDPTYDELNKSDLDLVIAGTEDSILMVEAGSNMLNEEMMLSAIEFGHNEIKKIVKSIKEFAEKYGKPKQKENIDYKLSLPNPKLLDYLNKNYYDKYSQIMHVSDKKERKTKLSELDNEVKNSLQNLEDDNEVKIIYLDRPSLLHFALDGMQEKIMKNMVLREGIRIDGRKNFEIRPITCKTSILPRTHGTGLFTRGQTQVLSVTTLGSIGDMQTLDEVSPEYEKRYLHHYNFPSYSVGEVKPLRSPGRREVGHGNLARRALLPVLPSEEEFPYTIRVVSEVLGSNGSSSMASTCGSTLSLLDAGVPLKKMVAGVAMGLIKGEQGEYGILTDILGDEDHLGDMDFKVTGTSTGITALQMDIKVRGISINIMKDALEQARKGRLFILRRMMNTITEPKPLSKYAPRIFSINIGVDKIGEVIGPAGKTIKKIVEETGVRIDVDDLGIVFISSENEKAANKAKEWIERLTRVVKAGEVYQAKVVKITNFGAFVELFTGTEGLIHVSQLSEQRVKAVEDILKIGDLVTVKVMEIDSQGRINLTRKGLADLTSVN